MLLSTRSSSIRQRPSIIRLSPWPEALDPGSPTSYDGRYQGRIFGVVNPTNSLNSIITDITNGAPVVSGSPNISYIANFQIVTLVDPGGAQRILAHLRGAKTAAVMRSTQVP